jgi:serine/threonine protein kinase
MEYCKHADLGKYLKRHGTLSEDYARVIALQVLQGLLKMHRNGFAHRDIKPAVSLIQAAYSTIQC